MGYSMKSGPDFGSILHDSPLGALYPFHFGITLERNTVDRLHIKQYFVNADKNVHDRI